MAGILAIFTVQVRSQGLLNDNFSDGKHSIPNLLSASSDAQIFTGDAGGSTPGTVTLDAVNVSTISAPEPPGFSQPLGLVPEPSALAMASIGFLSFVGINFFCRPQNLKTW